MMTIAGKTDADAGAERTLAANLRPRRAVFWDLTPAELVEHAIRRGEGVLVEGGAFNAVTAPHTGRSPKDRFVVREPSSASEIDWGAVNEDLEPSRYAMLREELVEHLEARDLFVRDMWAGADPGHRLPVRVITPSAWHSLFAYNMFRRFDPGFEPPVEARFTILHAPEFRAEPQLHRTRSETFIVLNLAEREILIGGTRYAGEIKKAVFSVMNYLLPGRDVLSMHCSANVGPGGDVSLFFGLSGTGKTTLSADPGRRLIGDDEHGWSDRGVFNIEGGCYAKVIRLSRGGEPEIFAATRRFGTVLENCVLGPQREADFDDERITENTRASYPLEYIPNHVPEAAAGHPRTVIFLTADAFGVLPPIARLGPEQAMYHFLSGYTAKVAGTERGVTEPQATFSACFGAPFLLRQPAVYARMLGEKIARNGCAVWLVNTGWTGGPYGTGSRIRLAYTRAMIQAALAGELDGVPSRRDPVFGFRVPDAVPGIPSELLSPRSTWADPDAYDACARTLAELFRKNFRRFETEVSDAVRLAGPSGG